MNDDLAQEALARLRTALDDPTAGFRDGQLEAILHLVADRRRALVVQRTGWGKSIVYFIATAMLRARGAGPTLIISPLLALMRNQVDAAHRLSLRAETINSETQEEWDRIFDELRKDRVDLLLISPERLANEQFLRNVGPEVFRRLGLLVVDEAHCISDWGHDFRPHYRLIGGFARLLPPNAPIIGTTATADRHVVEDVASQLGDNLLVQRGPLMRDELRFDVVDGLRYAERLAWLATVVPSLSGSGIVYVLTHRDAILVSEWLSRHGINAPAYYSGVANPAELERALLDNDVKALVATTKLGMGFDKPDLSFVIHFQGAASVIHYYQAAGRAGRAIPRADAILLGGSEDDDIFESFIRSALPAEALVEAILSELDAAADGLTKKQLVDRINAREGQIDLALTFLLAQEMSPVVRVNGRWSRTAVAFAYPREHAEALATRRRAQRAEMRTYLTAQRCLMVALAEPLRDATIRPCGRCYACTGMHVSDADFTPLIPEAEDFINRRAIEFEPRKQWPSGFTSDVYGFRGRISETDRAEIGRALAFYNVGTIGRRVRDEKYGVGHFSTRTVEQAAAAIRAWLGDDALPNWIVAVPSLRRPDLVPSFAQRLALELGIPYQPALTKIRETDEQKTAENSSFQVRNLDGSLAAQAFPGIGAPGLLVDDIVDSKWTMTVAVALLKRAGAGVVFPFALLLQSSSAEE